ncbi:MAG: hypothetical protein WC101_05705 [Candidatus Gracilibacteria bacterium]
MTSSLDTLVSEARDLLDQVQRRETDLSQRVDEHQLQIGYLHEDLQGLGGAMGDKEIALIQHTLRNMALILETLEAKATSIELQYGNMAESVHEQGQHIDKQTHETKLLLARYQVLGRAIQALRLLESQ